MSTRAYPSSAVSARFERHMCPLCADTRHAGRDLSSMFADALLMSDPNHLHGARPLHPQCSATSARRGPWPHASPASTWLLSPLTLVLDEGLASFLLLLLILPTLVLEAAAPY
jgi:hypothetical protein